MMAEIFVVINEQHKLLPDQERLLNEMFGEETWERLNIPAEGWTTSQQVSAIKGVANATLVFASPVPAMILAAERRVGGLTYVLVNDKRDKKEVPQPDGTVKIIFTVASTGWEIF